MTKQWSKSTIEETRRVLEDLSFFTRDGKLYFKHINGTFGYIEDGDAILGSYVMHASNGDLLITFETINDLITHGWVLD